MGATRGTRILGCTIESKVNFLYFVKLKFVIKNLTCESKKTNFMQDEMGVITLTQTTTSVTNA